MYKDFVAVVIDKGAGNFTLACKRCKRFNNPFRYTYIKINNLSANRIINKI